MGAEMTATAVKKHPVRGLFWGLFMGVGLALILIGRGVIAFGDTASFVIVVLLGMVISVLWSMFGPAKKPKGPPPSGSAAASAAPAASTGSGVASEQADDGRDESPAEPATDPNAFAPPQSQSSAESATDDAAGDEDDDRPDIVEI